jgi:2-polyprenyl-6-hydroxyphenyl methylase/3-demethylubiquinone-9 3-methyltransferase
MKGYYSAKLAGDRLRKCYDLASARVRQYLEAEIAFVLSRLSPGDLALELGCGYGRVAVRLSAVAGRVLGIDTSFESLMLARRLARGDLRCEFAQMDASALAVANAKFDVVVCVQNGLSAFAVDPTRVLGEALRVTRPGGRIVLSSYSASFWRERLGWFESQAAAGLVGTIDYDETRDGVIVCKDGFRARTFSPEAFRSLCDSFGLTPVITTVDESSVVCDIVLPEAAHQRAAPDGPRSLGVAAGDE